MPEFQYINFLIGLAAVPLLVFLFISVLRKKKAIERKIGDPVLVAQLSANHNKSAFLQKFLWVTLALGILVTTLANLRSPEGSKKISRNGIDVMIALDVSKSMLAGDIKPSRLDRAKQVLSRLVDKLGNDRIGIVVFAGKAYLQMPLTADHPAAKMYISAATTESVPTQGTVIGDALRMCNVSFNEKEKKYKAVILISDGEDHDENAIKTAEAMSESGVVINTIGIGSPQGAPLIDEATNEIKKDNEGNTVISKLNENELKLIASKANGQYVLFDNTENVVTDITNQLNSLDERNVTDDSLINYKSYFQFFLVAAFLFLLIEMFISEKRKLRNKYAPLKHAMSLLMVFATSFSQGQNVNENIKNGNDAYKKGEFIKAAGEYETVIKKDPANPAAQFNMGNAMYKTDKKDEAITAYDNAAEHLNNPVQKSNALYNKGVVLQNDKKLPECIESYKEALKLDPANEDARQNLQRALQQQKEQQKKEEKKKQDNKEQKKPQDKEEPKPRPSKITKQDADNKLKALMQQEKNLQDKLHKVNASAVNKPEKDW